jgi:hypothetical protein
LRLHQRRELLEIVLLHDAETAAGLGQAARR